MKVCAKITCDFAEIIKKKVLNIRTRQMATKMGCLILFIDYFIEGKHKASRGFSARNSQLSSTLRVVDSPGGE